MELDGFLNQLLCLRKGLTDRHTPGQVRDIGAVRSLALLDYYVSDKRGAFYTRGLVLR